jgi:hypothetical protein
MLKIKCTNKRKRGGRCRRLAVKDLLAGYPQTVAVNLSMIYGSAMKEVDGGVMNGML